MLEFCLFKFVRNQMSKQKSINRSSSSYESFRNGPKDWKRTGNASRENISVSWILDHYFFDV